MGKGSHLRSARKWLRRAEKAFDKKEDIRGELDLILAQAELQHVQEKKKRAHWQNKSRFLTNTAAFVLALFIAVLGLSGAQVLYSNSQHKNSGSPEVKLPGQAANQEETNNNGSLQGTEAAIQVNKEQQEIQISTGKNTESEKKLQIDSSTEKAGQLQQTDPAVVNPGAKEKVPSAEKQALKASVVNEAAIPAITHNELQKLVREAGKSLREGQNSGNSGGGNE